MANIHPNELKHSNPELFYELRQRVLKDSNPFPEIRRIPHISEIINQKNNSRQVPKNNSFCKSSEAKKSFRDRLLQLYNRIVLNKH